MTYHDQTDGHYHVDNALALCHFLRPHDSSLAAEVSLAITQPDAYLARFEHRLADRGIFETIPVLPWIAFLDGLVAREQLVEVDWREEASNVMRSLDHVLPSQLVRPDRWEWVDKTVWDNAPTLDFLKAIGARLVGQSFILADCQSARFVSDSYALVVIRKDRFTAARQLTKEFGPSDMIPCLKDGLLSVEL